MNVRGIELQVPFTKGRDPEGYLSGFYEGAEAMLDAQRPIPVAERLPEPDVDVLAYRNRTVWVAWCDGADVWHDGEEKGRCAAPTHWMPLPPGPEAEAGQEYLDKAADAEADARMRDWNNEVAADCNGETFGG